MLPPSRWLWDYLPGNTDQVDFVTISSPRDRFPGYGKLLAYYPQYAWLGLKAWPRLADYDLIVAWEGKNGVALALLRSLLRRSRPPMLILNFVLKGQVVLSNLWLMRYALRSVDCLSCVSNQEVAYYPQVLRLPADVFVQMPTVWPDHYTDRLPTVGDYIFAAGRSHRDYATLLEAVRGLPVRLIVNARSFNLQGLSAPDNVTLNPFLPSADFHRLVLGARFAVLPLHAARHASGETFLLEAMSARKPVIATRTYSTVEFIRPNHNGLLVEPGDVSGLRRAIEQLLADEARTAAMGLNARQDYEQNWSLPVIARRVETLARQIVERSLSR